MTEPARGNAYVINPDVLNRRIAEYEEKWPEFSAIYDEPTCCPGCMVPYERWSFDQVVDWEKYYALRWLRGDTLNWEDGDD